MNDRSRNWWWGEERRGARRLTAEQFEQEYAARSGVTVEWLREHERVVRPCGPELGCDDSRCEGWQSVNKALWEEDQALRAGMR